MKPAAGVIVAGILLAIVGAIAWAVTAAKREAAETASDFAVAYGGTADSVSSAGVWFSAAVVGFGALVLLTGVALAVIKAR